MAILGDRWSTVMLAAALPGTRRFGDFERDLGVPPTLLARRLRAMVELGVLRRVPSPAGAPPSTSTGSPTRGWRFFPVMMLVMRWADRWMATPEGPPVRVTHPACGAVLDPELRCGGCGAVARAAARCTSGGAPGAAAGASRRRIIGLTPGSGC